MNTIAQTNIQLYNQLRQQNRSAEDLGLIRSAYDLARRLFCSHFQASGAQFVAHLTGVASIVANLRLPSEYVAAACLHNVYANADFADGRGKCATQYRRRLVSDAVGGEIEGLVHRFWRLLRADGATLLDVAKRVDSLDSQDRQLLVMDLADAVENSHELGLLYCGDRRSTEYLQREQASLTELARHLGHPALADMLSSVIAELEAERTPESLQPGDPSNVYARQQLPRSCMRRPDIAARHFARQSLRRTLRRFR
ncbi:hypothetical protein BH24PSE2_BH24PSE2_08820 [soil metagenome]